MGQLENNNGIEPKQKAPPTVSEELETYLRSTTEKSRYADLHTTVEEIGQLWKRRKEHSLHTLVPRLGGFPPGLARWAINEYSIPGDLVLDPFCGKGTAPLEALLNRRNAIGSDAAPDAFVITHAKTSGVAHEEAEAFLRGVNLSVARDLGDVPPDVRLFFSDKTLSQILCLREALFEAVGVHPGHIEDLNGRRLSKRARVALYLFACLLGCLHGPVKWGSVAQPGIEGPNKDSLYLSVHCNHTYSASPQYVRRYCNDNGLRPPERDVKASVLRKSKLAQADKTPPLEGRVYCRRAGDLRAQVRANLIVTSPPYFLAQTYAWDNWLRLWCLGYNDYRVIAKSLLQTQSIPLYYKGIYSSFKRVKALMAPGARAVVVVGDVRTRLKGNQAFLKEHCRWTRYVQSDPDRGSFINTSEVIADVAGELGLEVEKIVNDFIPRSDRALASYLGPHDGTDVDRAVVLRSLTCN